MNNMSFNPQAVRAGNSARKEAEEFPTTFGTTNGADFSAPSQGLDKQNQNRMAGPGGAFALQMMQDPKLQERVLQWNKRFMQSNQGMEFNKAQMMMMGGGGAEQQPAEKPQQPQQQKPAEEPKQKGAM